MRVRLGDRTADVAVPLSDPALRFTGNGAAVGNLTVISTPCYLKGGQWQDGEPLFMRCNTWKSIAENVVEPPDQVDPTSVRPI